MCAECRRSFRGSHASSFICCVLCVLLRAVRRKSTFAATVNRRMPKLTTMRPEMRHADRRLAQPPDEFGGRPHAGAAKGAE